jgi:surfeit locus 1 family protein
MPVKAAFKMNDQVSQVPVARSGGLLTISICTALALAILVGVGFWQLKRLAWKEGLIAQINEQISAAPVSLETVEEEFFKGRNVRFRKVVISGTYEHEKELHLYSILKGRQGWRVITPLRFGDNRVVLVDRGFVPEENKLTNGRKDGLPIGTVEISGNIRTHLEGKGYFTPPNQPQINKWFWYSVTNMLAAVTDKMNRNASLFFIQLDQPDHQTVWPKVVKVSPKLTNNHFGYALTWFALAITLAGVYAAYVFAWRRRR